jgi:superfamily II DNA helicase RecQ
VRPVLVSERIACEDARRLSAGGRHAPQGVNLARQMVAAFRIFTDQALRAMVSKRPETDRELLTIPGIGMTTVKQYGPQIYRVIHGSSV